MSFASDNAAPIHPAILEAMAAANHGHAPSYGADAWTARAERLLREVFECDCAVLLVATGTAANALALSALSPPWGAVFCHRQAHILEDEAGAPEFYTGGARLLPLDGHSAKITPETLTHAASSYSRAWVHGAQPFAVSITQASESGASYRSEEVGALSEAARAQGLKLHMDGARFANAAAFTGASPAALTWKAGVDILSFGATKNGAMAVEAIVCFDPEAAKTLPHLRKRAGHLLSKHRYLGAQMAAYLEGGLWLRLAAHANAMAQHLAQALRAAGRTLLHPVEANEVFAQLRPGELERLQAACVGCYAWEADGPGAARFVCSWATEADEIARAAGVLAHTGV
jgi:threonine aldolase